MPSPTIFVDADACPVREEVLRVAFRHNMDVVMVSNGGIRPSREPNIRIIIVPHGADAADDWIVDHAVPRDIVVTADIELAQRALARGAEVLGPTGKPFTTESIGMAMAMRDLGRHLRESGELSNGNRPFDAKDRSRFLSALDAAVQRSLRGN